MKFQKFILLAIVTFAIGVFAPADVWAKGKKGAGGPPAGKGSGKALKHLEADEPKDVIESIIEEILGIDEDDEGGKSKADKDNHGAEIIHHEKTEDGVEHHILMPDGTVKKVGSAYAGQGKGKGHKGKGKGKGGPEDTEAEKLMKDAKKAAKEKLEEMGIDADLVEGIAETVLESTKE